MTGMRSYAGPRCAVLCILACLLAVVSIGLASFAMKTFREREQGRLLPVHTGFYRADNESLIGTSRPLDAARTTRVVFFGDSRIHQWSPAPAIRHVEAVWRGIPGETTAQMIYRFREDVLALSPHVVVIQAGINDVVAGSVLGLGEESVASAVRNLQDMIDLAHRSGIRVLMLTVIQPSRPSLLRRAVWSPEIPALVASLNTSLQALTRESVEVLDVNSVLAPDGGPLPARFARDTLHLSSAGYLKMNGLVERSIERLSSAVQ